MQKGLKWFVIFLENKMYNVLILGSGRSGTSMLAGTLANSGYNLGANSNYLGENKANPKGFFEDYEINTINEDILKLILPHIPEKLRVLFFRSKTFYRARWLAQIPLNKCLKSTSIIDLRIKEIIKQQPFCFKDPRFSYTLPIWKRQLPKDTKFIVIYREPNKTVDSIVRECKENKALLPLKMNKKNAVKVWYLMYKHILKNYSEDCNKKNWMFIHYNQMFSNDKVLEVEQFLNCKPDNSFAEKRISRSILASEELDEKIEYMYNKLNILAKY